MSYTWNLSFTTHTNKHSPTTTFTNILSNLYQQVCRIHKFSPPATFPTLAEKKRHRPKGCETKGMSAAHQQKGSAGQGGCLSSPPGSSKLRKINLIWYTPGRPKKTTATKTNSILTPWAYPSKLGTPGPTCRNDGIYIIPCTLDTEPRKVCTRHANQ